MARGLLPGEPKPDKVCNLLETLDANKLKRILMEVLSTRDERAVRPAISIIVCSADRARELQRLLMSIRTQTYRRFEVILVDQYPDSRIVSLVERFSDHFRLVHVRSAPGVSRGRNVGLAHCEGDVVAIPDDDCWYGPEVLERIAQTFVSRPDAGFIIARWSDPSGRDGFPGRAHVARQVGAREIWVRAMSFTIFLRRRVIERVGDFDERLSFGSETDYLLRAAEAGINGWYDPCSVVRHPRVRRSRAHSRAFSYGRGMGFVMRKHRPGFVDTLTLLGRPLAATVYSLARLKWAHARFHFLVFAGQSIGRLGIERRRAISSSATRYIGCARLRRLLGGRLAQR